MNKESNDYKYRFLDILTLEFGLSEHPREIEEILKKIRLDFETGFRFEAENDRVNFDLFIFAISEIEEASDEENKKGKKVDELNCFKIKLRNVFKVNDLKKHLEENNIKEDKGFLVTLAAISYSTARGILKEKLSGTRYDEDFILPIMDPNKFVKSSESKEE